jgi:hypothetical protein
MIVRVIKLRSVRGNGHVLRREEMKDAIFGLET